MISNKDPWMMEGGPAFPSAVEGEAYKGMSLRDWFAGQALVGLAHEADCFWAGAPRLAYQFADAMLAERRKKTGD